MKTAETAAANGWQDRFWQSEDGLALHYRDYPGPRDGAAMPVLCIPGLTRNARDFHDLAMHLSRTRRVISVDLRGRGDSEFAKDSATYNPLQYAQDLEWLFPAAGIDQAIFIGSSLGGIVTMICAVIAPDRIGGAVLNDVGPVVELEGLLRIANYVGQGRSFPTWMHAARALEEGHGHVHPEWGIIEWLAEAKRIMELGGNGRISFDYDMRIGDGLAEAAEEVARNDFWAGFEALAGRPVLVVRGEHSDVLSARTAQKMVERNPDTELVTVLRTGHLPMLSLPPVLPAIERLVEQRLSSAAVAS